MFLIFKRWSFHMIAPLKNLQNICHNLFIYILSKSNASPLILSCSAIFDIDGKPFVYLPFIHKWHAFHIPSLDIFSWFRTLHPLDS